MYLKKNLSICIEVYQTTLVQRQYWAQMVNSGITGEVTEIYTNFYSK